MAATGKSDKSGRPEASVAELKTERTAASPAGMIRLEPLVGRLTRTIEVVGNGEWRAVPDRVLLNLAIETRALSAQQSAAQNASLA
ncbi:MAG TPA: SIMPL domain-containing protein, partial [Candidatus Binataceae bacterium]|nr:SIMPL domain-containing protein [Candidatus Binataceae bacterium]